jgi:hypothetical protein
MWRIEWTPNSIPVYSHIQQDVTLHSLFVCGNCSTCFGWYFHPSSGAHTTVSTASGICHTVTAICCYRGRVGTGLSVLWMAYTTYSTLKPVYWNILTMHGPINVKSPNNTSKWQMRFNLAFKGLICILPFWGLYWLPLIPEPHCSSWNWPSWHYGRDN